MTANDNIDWDQAHLALFGTTSDLGEAQISPSALTSRMLEAMQDRDEPKARELLAQIVRVAPGQLDGALAGSVIQAALDSSAALFEAVLEHVTDNPLMIYHFRDRPAQARFETYTRVQGTPPVIAAALNKPEHLRVLLERGYDCNGDETENAISSYSRWNVLQGETPAYSLLPPGCLAPYNQCYILPESEEWPLLDLSLNHVTPLAAAIIFGSEACVRVLLEQPGVWLTETPSVCQALAMGLQGQDSAPSPAAALVWKQAENRPFLLAETAEECSTDALKELLRRRVFPAEELKRTVQSLARRYILDSDSRREKLRLLGEICPEALRTGCVPEQLAVLSLTAPTDMAFRALASDNCPEVIDLSPYAELLCREEPKSLEPALEAWKQCHTLVMSRDSVPEFTRSRVLRILIRQVSFLPSGLTEGLSGLTCAILRTGSTSLMKYALNRQVIPAEESVGDILTYLRLNGDSVEARALFLAARRPSLGISPKPPEIDPEILYAETAIGLIETADPILLACMQGGKDAADAAAEFVSACRGSPGVLGRVRLHRDTGVCSDGWFYLSPLCAAAMAGKTGVVKALLDMGLDPEERDAGHPSQFMLSNCYTQWPMSPLAAAEAFGHSETAAVLRKHGASLNMEGRMYTELSALLKPSHTQDVDGK